MAEPVSTRRLTRRVWLRHSATLAAGAALSACTTSAPVKSDYRPQLIEVRPPAPLPGKAWLFGSVHAGQQNLYPLPAPVLTRWRGADRLAVELDLSTRWEELKTGFSQVALLPNGERLERYLEPALVDSMRQRFSIDSVAWKRLSRLQPWVLSMVLQQRDTASAGISEDFGIDQHFLKLAAKAGRPVSELEQAHEQIEAFSSGTIAEQVELLKARLSTESLWETKLSALVNHWRSGDQRALLELKQQAFGRGEWLATLRDRLFHQREQRMAERLLSLMREPQSVFVVVGAFHLVGSPNLSEYLQRRGATIERIQYA